MADARALLKQKRQEARITHPYASYSSAGQLRCTICSTAVKHASAWEGHLGSKAHRTNVLRVREEERKAAEAQAAAAMQVQEEEEEDMDAQMASPENTPATNSHPSAKRKHDASPTAHKEKKRKTEGFPADFFSDKDMVPVLLSDDDSEEEEEGQGEAKPQSAVDLEYERFQRELLQPTLSAEDREEAYQRATVAAEPELVPATADFPGATDANVPSEEAALLTEEGIRQKKEQEERELIMDRLLEEERAQEDADNKVLLLKNKVEMLKQKRLAARAAKAKEKAGDK